MTYTMQMLETYPADINMDHRQLAAAIDSLNTCAQACTACADSCLSEAADALPMLTRCIRDNLDCAEICTTTASVLSRHTGYDAAVARAQVRAAAQATRTCGDSCAEHASMHEHCRICAQACRETEQALNALFVALQPTGDAPGHPSATAPQQRA